MFYLQTWWTCFLFKLFKKSVSCSSVPVQMKNISSMNHNWINESPGRKGYICFFSKQSMKISAEGGVHTVPMAQSFIYLKIVIFDCIDKAYLKKANFCIYHAIYFIYIYSAQCNCRAKCMHIGWNKTNTSKLLLVSCFHIHPAYTITLTRYTHYIITTKFKLLSHFLTPISTVLVNIAVNQYDATLNIIIWCFSRGIYFDSNIWKFCTLVQKILSICSRNYVLFCYAQITMSCTTSIRGGISSYTPF